MQNIAHTFLFVLLFLAGIAEGAPQERYKMYCLYTPDFETMYSQYFLPSLKDDFDIVAAVFDQDCATGTIHSAGWDVTMLHKLEFMIQAIKENWGEVFFFSDIDIIFLKPILEISLEHLGQRDFVVQRGWPRRGICAGFFVMRGNKKTLDLITRAHTLLKRGICIDDQIAIQVAIRELPKGSMAWKMLPSEQYPTGKRVLKNANKLYTPGSEVTLTDEMILFHANACLGLENKYHFLEHVQQLYNEKVSVNHE